MELLVDQETQLQCQSQSCGLAFKIMNKKNVNGYLSRSDELSIPSMLSSRFPNYDQSGSYCYWKDLTSIPGHLWVLLYNFGNHIRSDHSILYYNQWCQNQAVQRYHKPSSSSNRWLIRESVQGLWLCNTWNWRESMPTVCFVQNNKSLPFRNQLQIYLISTSIHLDWPGV